LTPLGSGAWCGNRRDVAAIVTKPVCVAIQAKGGGLPFGKKDKRKRLKPRGEETHYRQNSALVAAHLGLG